jgi:Ca2+-binding EF-hand superfamily protein
MFGTLPHALLIATAALVGSTAFAQAAPSFASLDKNADGKLSLDEASANDKLFVAFKSLDKDKDGSLTQQEFAAYKPS